ncbi:MAG: S8 family serine peptidase [candidate division KSB1 bacterium]|jgi:subtilisin family serine protease|nr:S8 family serine peptidase [candidate division KSB1 bacterium]
MKTVLKIWLCLFTLFSSPLIADDFSKIDPWLRNMIKQPEIMKIYGVRDLDLSKNTAEMRTSVILKTTLNSETLESMGMDVRARIGDIATASIPIAEIPRLAELDEVTYIQAPKRIEAHTDISMSEIGALNIYQDYGIKGSGVIIGIIDTGIDWTHDDFRNPDGTTRIMYILDFSSPGDIDGDGDLDGPDAYGGTLYTESDINNALSGFGNIFQDDVVGHGTHVAGCAAGNGLATGNGYPAFTYAGVAPEADLVVVKATRNQGSRNFVSDDYIAALAFINDVATSTGKPFVANMSLGGSDGAHDGTSLGEQAIDNLVGSGKPGKAVVVSAGNDGEDAIHASGNFSQSVSQTEINFKVDTYQNEAGTYNDYVLFEIWYDGAASISVSLEAPDGTVYGPVARRNERSWPSENGAVLIDNARGGAYPFNGDNQIVAQIFDFSEDQPPKAGDWKFTLTGNSGRYDLWLSGASMDAYLTSNIDESMLVANPGSAENAITVGSYVTKNNWIDLDGKSVSPVPRPDLYTASTFSSPGPTRDFRTKPEICAPGEWIASSYSIFAPPSGLNSMFDTQNDNLPNGFIMRDGEHAMAQGTSFSAPHVTGIIALMLQQFPSLDALEIKAALTENARQDAYTTSPAKWGYGKLDGYATIQDLSGALAEKKFTVSIFQNPALSQYIDIYLISKYLLADTPAASMQVGGGAATNISMSKTDGQIYKGEYTFSSDGTATLTVNATVQGEPTTTLTRYFGVSLLKAGTGGHVQFGNASLIVPGESIDRDTYFTIIPSDIDVADPECQSIGDQYQMGPVTHSLSGRSMIEFNYDPSLEDLKLSIARLEDGQWIHLDTHKDRDRNVVTAHAEKMGTFAVFMTGEDDLDTSPATYVLHQNYPNPFNASTYITYTLPEQAHISLQIYNIRGERTATLFRGVQPAGIHKIEWDGRNDSGQVVSSGVYLYRLTSDHFSSGQKMIYLK